MGTIFKYILARLIVLTVLLNVSCATTAKKDYDPLVDTGELLMPLSQINHENGNIKRSFFDNGDMMSSDLILGYYASEPEEKTAETKEVEK